jgi:NADP-dependent 3-hydroxy acid dehydrogenase YdfG
MQGARVLIAGASGDIGQAIAVELLRAGSSLVVLGRSLERLKSANLPEDRHNVEYLAADLTDLSALDQLANDINRKGKLDALILSSGTYTRSQDPHDFRQQIDANIIGPYALLQATLPALIESKGQIVFVNSSQALHGTAGVGQYAATKHALKAIADSTRAEVNERDVRVMSLYLGRTAGNRQREIFSMEGRDYDPARLIQPNDVAQMVFFLLQMPRTVEVTDVMMRPMLKG